MGITQMKIVVTVAGFLLIFLSGYLLNRSGQPFNAGVLTVHKLLSVALIVYLVVAVLKIDKIAPLDKVELIACVVAALLFLGAVASGGILSAVRTMPEFVRMLHRLLPALAFLTTAVTFYLFVRRT
jgi:heme A synthase